mmetsp:Transcript_43445/g.143771  ORF Transcript_43445/g.143771 Transcript_43445/m.143771 type:complete len:218 (+) Transcript_43445:343-996(+)
MIAPAPKFALRRMGGAAMSHPSASTSESIASTSAARYTGLRFPSPPFAPMPPALKSTPVREVSSRAAVPAPYPTHVWPAPPFSPGTIVSDSSAGAARPRVRYAGERAARCGAAESNHACCSMAAGERRSAWSMASMPSRRLSASSVRRCCLPYHCSTVETVHLPSCCARLSLSYLQSACDASSSGKKPSSIAKRATPHDHTSAPKAYPAWESTSGAQ